MPNSDVLTLPRDALTPLPEQGAWAWNTLSAAVEPAWIARDVAEQDPRHLQLIPYLLLLNPRDQIWSYARRTGDRRLLDRRSCGVGGHVEPPDHGQDLETTLANALRREVAEELGERLLEPLVGITPQAWIYEHLSAIGRVHIGVLYTARWSLPNPPQPLEEGLESLGFLPAETILSDQRFELWSRLAVSWLNA